MDFYQAPKSSNELSQEVRNTPDNLHRRHPGNGGKSRRDCHGKGFRTSRSAVPWVCDKPEEIGTKPFNTDGVLRFPG